MEHIFEKIRDIVTGILSCSAHSMDHVLRVYELCLKLSEGEPVDIDVLRAAALLHDVARAGEDDDPTGTVDHAETGANMAVKILEEIGFQRDKISHVHDCILTHRFRAGRIPETLEAKILFDADKLDTLGAIGVARAFAWIGKNGAPLYSDEDADIERYTAENLGGDTNGRIRDSSRHTIKIEFETKLKFVADRLYTQRARDMARARSDFFREFMDRFDNEIRGIL